MKPTIQELEAQLAAAKEEERKADEAKRKAQTARWEELKANPDSFEWKVKPGEYFYWTTTKKLVGVEVQCRVKPEVLEAWRKDGHGTFGAAFQEPDRWFGMFYYRTDENILTHEGGGHHVLNTPKLCNDEEWAAIQAGNIPLKYRK